jgi:lysophospholipase L1-like esterase
MRRRLVPVFVVSLLLAAVASCTPAPPKPTLLVYGDSLTVISEQAMDYLYASKYTIVFRAEGGSAMCDFSGEAVADRLIYHPSRVVIAFTGNDHTCVAQDYKQSGKAGFLANYSRSLGQFHAAFAGLPISVVASPAMHSLWPADWFPENGDPALNDLYKTLCAEGGMTYNPAADNSLSPGHVFAWKRPRFVNGPMVEVRSSDGVHLSPDGELWYASALGA